MNVIVYSKTNCQGCRQLKKWLTSKAVPFNEFNVEEHPDKLEFIKEKGFMSLPITQIDDTFISGFNISAIQNKLKETN